MALGAQDRDVKGLFVRIGALRAGVGIAIGLAVAVLLGRALEALLVGVNPGDPVTFVTVGAVLVSVGLLGAYLPARKASSMDPMRALRVE